MKEMISKILASRPLVYLLVMLVLIFSTLPLLWVYEKKALVAPDIIISIMLTPVFAEWILSRKRKS